jgi:3-oxoadipate enol-lactonase
MNAIKTDFVPSRPRLAYDHAGAGPVLVFLHGIGGNRGNWRDQLAGFAPDYHAAAWDARGYGASDDYDRPLDFADFSADLLRLLDHLGAERAHLCGLSMGGRILLDFEARYPERVATLTLVSTFPGFTTSFRPEKQEEFLRLRRQPLLEGKEPRDIAPAIVASLTGPSSTDAVKARLTESLAALHKQSYIKTLEATTRYDRSADLPHIAAPVLLIYGTEDRLTPVKIGRAMAGQIPNAQLVVIEQAAHLVNIEKPQAFDAALRAFLLPRRGLAQERGTAA